MNDQKKRREDLLTLIRHPEHQGKVINYLKNLKGIPVNEPLPNGTPIISEIIRLESLQASDMRGAFRPCPVTCFDVATPAAH